MSFFEYPTTGDEEVDKGQQYFLPGRTEEDWLLFLEHTRSRHVRAGEAVIDPTQVDRALYIVIDGVFEVRSVTESRRRSRCLATLGAGTVIGELSFFDGRAPSALVVAVTDGELARLTLEDLEALARRGPDLARAILFDLGRIMATRLRTLQSDALALA